MLKAYYYTLIIQKIVDEEIIILKVKELLNLLYKINSNNIRDLLHDMFNPHNYDFKNIVNKNIHENLSTEELAHLCNLSLSSFKRKFRTIFKDSPASYIKNKRLDKAAQLLHISKNRVIDICFDCGFSNVDNFFEIFQTKIRFYSFRVQKKSIDLN